MSESTVESLAGLAASRHPHGLLRSALRLVWLGLARSRERRALASMDARGLRDIGLTPYEAGVEARKPFWQG